MPHILRIINRLNLGGPTYNAANLCAFMPPEFETLLVSGMKEETEESSEYILNELGLQPIYIPEMKRQPEFPDDYVAYRRLRRIIREFKPDIVHTHAAKAGTLGRLAASHERVPVIVHTFHGHVFHSYFSRTKTLLYLAVERFLAKRSSAVIALSNSQRDELVNIYKISDSAKVKVIPLGFDLGRFRQQQEELRSSFRKEFQLEDHTCAIGIIGRLVPVKNHSLFVKAIKLLQQRTTHAFHAFIIGDGESRELIEAECRSQGLAYSKQNERNANAVITFTSWIKNIEWPLAGLDIVALTSFNEGTPVSLIEAQAAGRAIVSTDVGGIRDVVLPGESAFLVPGDADAVAEKLLYLVKNAGKRNEMASKGWHFVEIRFHYRRLVNDMAALYNELLLTKTGK